MADIPKAPIEHPMTDSRGMLTEVWVLWFKRVEAILRGLT